MTEFTLAELIIVACAEAWRHDPELMASGITPLPRLGASLAKTLYNPALMLTNGENWFVGDPVPPGARTPTDAIEGWAPYTRTFDNLWGGKRHAMVAPVQIDRFGQTNISVIGDHARPKVQMLGARGFPGNSVHHPNSFFFANHNKRAFVPGEVDFVCMAGHNPARWLGGRAPLGLDLRIIVTNLCVMDFGAPENAIRLVSLHPGVPVDEVRDNTGFDVIVPEGAIPTTPAPSAEALAEIARLDPKGVRHKMLKDNPPGIRTEAA